MSSENAKIDDNEKPVAMAITDDSNQYRKMLRIDDTTKGLKVMMVGGGGTTISLADIGITTPAYLTFASAATGSASTLYTTPRIEYSQTIFTSGKGLLFGIGNNDSFFLKGVDSVVSGANGSAVRIYGGKGLGNGNGGGVYINGGQGGGGASSTGVVTIESSSGYAGGIVTLQAGNGTQGGGDLILNAGDGIDQAGGTTYIRTGNSTNANAGDLQIILGTGVGSVPGYIILYNLPTSGGGPTGSLWSNGGQLMIN